MIAPAVTNILHAFFSMPLLSIPPLLLLTLLFSSSVIELYLLTHPTLVSRITTYIPSVSTIYYVLLTEIRFTYTSRHCATHVT